MAAVTARFLPALFCLLLPVCVTACGGSAPVPQVAFPGQIGDFTLQNVSSHGQGAAYVMDETDPVTATVRIGQQPGRDYLVPGLDLGGDDLDATVNKTGIGIKRFYPDAKLVLDEPLYLVHDDELKPGRHQTWRYRDAFLGTMQEVDMDVVINCCSDRNELVNVWFRHRSDRPIEADMLGFLNALPWN